VKLAEPAAAARKAGLRYVSRTSPGIRREVRGKGLVYRLPNGGLVRDKPTLERIRRLAVPPAWENVWICPLADGHIQATGYDVKGRLQYRYHGDWTAVRNGHKFDTLCDFARALPAIRRRVSRDLRLPGMPRNKVCACVVLLMDRTMIRIGNSEYARDNESYGLTTIRNRHAKVRGSKVRLCFKGKSGVVCDVEVESPRAAAIVRRCQELPGQELFCYQDDAGKVHDIGSGDVNEYLREITGEEVTAKDFRTWGGTCAAAARLLRMPAPGPGIAMGKGDIKRREVEAVRAAAAALSNTVAVCRKFYVHPGVIEAYASGRLHGTSRRARAGQGLSAVERVVAAVLKRSCGGAGVVRAREGASGERRTRAAAA
jgi:DNA topoisomerase-1